MSDGIDNFEPRLTTLPCGSMFEVWLEDVREMGLYNMFTQFDEAYYSACALAVEVGGWKMSDLPSILQSICTWMRMSDDDRSNVIAQSRSENHSNLYDKAAINYGLNISSKKKVMELAKENCFFSINEIISVRVS